MKDWIYKHFKDLTLEELYAILAIRSEVFIVEQNCPYQDLDGKDIKAYHLFRYDNTGKILACCRILPPGVSYKEASIGRVLSKGELRKTGLGRELMKKAMELVHQNYPNSEIRISAQLYLEKFYHSFGFITIGEPYMEDNIPHIQMISKSAAPTL